MKRPAIWLTILFSCLLNTAMGASIDDAEQALQARDYSKALEHLGKSSGDYAEYLAGIAHYQLENFAEAEKSGAALAAKADSEWRHKARFLQARALVAMKKHQEAEAVFSSEAERLFSKERKTGIAQLLIRFADQLAKEPHPDELDALPADFAKAHALYTQVLALEIDRELRDDITFRAATMLQKLSQNEPAIAAFQAYLNEFDPTWAGPVGSAERHRGHLRENQKPAGKHRLQARHELVILQRLSGQTMAARQNAEELIALIQKEQPDDVAFLADIRLLRARTFENESNVELATAALLEFLKQHPDHKDAAAVSRQIGLIFAQYGSIDDAVVAHAIFVEAQNFTAPNDPDAKPDATTGLLPAEQIAMWQQQAFYQIGDWRFQQKKYDEAIAQWQAYVKRYPNGAEWAASQNGIINAEFQIALDAVAANDEKDAREKLDAFLTKHPLDERARQIMFILGQIHYSKAEETDDEGRYKKAIAEWSRLISKYPGTEESSLALYRTGLVQSEKFDQLEEALATFRKLNWGSWAAPAQSRVQMLSQESLGLATERSFRTNEVPKVKVAARNIETLKLSQYFINIESYFRKTHELGSIEHLDIDLIAPDKTWEVKLDAYKKYHPLEQEIDVPFDGNKPGICLIKAEGGDWSATTLVVRSDIDLILKSSRREALVYVQNIGENKPVAGARVLLSDGERIIATGVTGADGVFRIRAEALKTAGSIRVLAVTENGAASNLIDVSSLQFSSGLSKRGYVYTSKSAYNPGETLHYKAVLRDVKDGSYIVPENRDYIVRILDGEGRLLRETEATLSDLGTLHGEFDLPEAASLGDCVVNVSAKKGGANFTGNFTVAEFQLQQIELAFDFPQTVWFRGEKIIGSLSARYYWGSPAGNQLITYTLPDGRTLTSKTDEEGKVAIEMETSGFQTGQYLNFTASLPSLNLNISETLMLATQGFGIAMKPDQPVALANETFEVSITTLAADREPIGKELTVTVMRSETRESNRVLEAVPWINHQPEASASVTVSEHKVTTDAKTGKGILRLKLDKGGFYTLRASGQDRFDQTVSRSVFMGVSDDEDQQKLRLFADKTTWDVGSKIPLQLHSRADEGLALLTFEGEEILHHEIITLKKGNNPLEVDVAHEHFPNFRVSVAMIDGRELRAATKRFNIRRELKIAIKPAQEFFTPGAEGRFDIEVTDQLGRPVEAELSLALVNEALFALHPDNVSPIVSFFQEGATRYTEFALFSTCGFAYNASSKIRVKQEGDLGGTQLVLGQNNIQQVAFIQNQELKLNSSNQALFATCMSNEFNVFNRTTGGGQAESLSQVFTGVGRFNFGMDATNFDGLYSDDPFAPIAVPTQTISSVSEYDPPEIPQEFAGMVSTPETRNVSHAVRWLPAFQSDAAGKASVSISLPDTAGEWRLLTKGCTVETLVGQAEATIVTRKDFFADIRLPAELQEGDEMKLLATIHNLTDKEGAAKISLKVEGGESPFVADGSVNVTKNGATEFVFKPFTVPFATALQITLESSFDGKSHAFTRVVPVRPWGIEFSSAVGGVTSNSTGMKLELPEGQTYKNRQLLVTLSPSIEQAIIDIALGRSASVHQTGSAFSSFLPGQPQTPGSQLLAAASALSYARARGADAREIAALQNRTSVLVASSIVYQEKDGAWAWNRTSNGANLVSTAMGYWALRTAEQAGIAVHPATLASAEARLNSLFVTLNANDSEGKAVLIHALSVGGKADFSNANRLYRERNQLSETALAYMAAAFVRMGREEFARDLLTLLTAKAVNAGGTNYWKSGSSHPLLRSNTETSALAVWAYAQVDRNAPIVANAAGYLLGELSRPQSGSASSLGPVTAALAAFYADGEKLSDDFELVIHTNDKEQQRILSKDLRHTAHFVMPAESLVAGANSVRIEMKGRGRIRYGATLSGFSADMTASGDETLPDVQHRQFYHDKLSYRDVPLNAESTSPVTKLELGQRVRVSVSVNHPKNISQNRYLTWEETIPAGMMLVEKSVRGNFRSLDTTGSRIQMHFVPGNLSTVSYELVAHAPGKYRVLPGVIRDGGNSGTMRIGSPGELTILGLDELSDDPYALNRDEHFELANKLFNDGHFDKALVHLDTLFNNKDDRGAYEKDLARMLLWIHTEPGREKLEATRIIEMFETLRERHPDLVIPFDRILTVGQAYRQIGEFERAWLVARATIYSSFLNDSRISAVLEDQGNFLASVKYQEDLWREYPDSAEAVTAYFALSQSLFKRAPEARAIALREKRLREKRAAGEPDEAEPETKAMLQDSRRLLSRFQTLYADDPLADEAAFSDVNVYFALKDYENVVKRAELSAARHPKSEFKSSFEYMAALGHFWQRHYEQALTSAKSVANGESKDRDYARYIVAQIFHATNRAADALPWYEKVKELYPDAAQAIAYFEQKKVAINEISTFKPGEELKLDVRYRNIAELDLQVYKVDLLKLYLREKNLANITKVDLAGIDPEATQTIQLGDGKDYRDQTKEVKLALKDEGAYLVICRGDNLFTSGLVLITPLKLEIQENADEGSVRVNVLSSVADGFESEVKVNVVGSENGEMRSGETDLRGVFHADGVLGTVTILAQAGDNLFAFYRGKNRVGKFTTTSNNQVPNIQTQALKQEKQQDKNTAPADYLKNVDFDNGLIIEGNTKNWDTMRRGKNNGVEAQNAY